MGAPSTFVWEVETPQQFGSMIVTAEGTEVEVEDGCLVIYNGEAVSAMFSPGQWNNVRKAPTAERFWVALGEGMVRKSVARMLRDMGFTLLGEPEEEETTHVDA